MKTGENFVLIFFYFMYRKSIHRKEFKHKISGNAVQIEIIWTGIVLIIRLKKMILKCFIQFIYIIFQKYLYIYIYTHTLLLTQKKLVSWGCRIHQLHLYRGVRPRLPAHVLDMTLNCIWWRGSSPRSLRNIEYLFIAIALRSTLTWSGGTC